MSADHLAIDFETFYSKKRKLTVKTMIAEQYCNHPEVDAYMISVCDGKTAWSGHPNQFNWTCLTGRTVVSHHKYFDLNVWLSLARRGVCPSPDYGEFHCTANLTAWRCNRRALNQACEHLYGLQVDKSVRSDANDKRWPQDFSKDEQAAMLKYAKSDAELCWKLYADLGDAWPAHEKRLSNLTIHQGMRGVQIDRDLLMNYICWSHESRDAIENLIPWIKDSEADEWEDFPAKPTSTKCIAEQCRRSGIPCPPVKSEDEEGYAEWEEEYYRTHKWIKALTAWRSINKLYQTFLVMQSRLRPDGTMPFGLKYFGAHTGRDSGDGRVNMLNQRRLPVMIGHDLMPELDDDVVRAAKEQREEIGKYPEWVLHVIDFRNLIIPRSGKKMIVSDLSQIEPRVLAYLTGNWELLEMIKKGMSIYEAHARATMGWKGGKLRDESPGTYALAKARVLALGYGAGWKKFIIMARDLAGLDIAKDDPEWEMVMNRRTGELEKKPGYGAYARKTVAEFREQNSKTKDLWDRLDNSLHCSVGGDFNMTLPSGRVMRYGQVRCETRIEPDEDGKPRKRSVYTANVDGRRKPFYGGKLTENLVQATARDVFSLHELRLTDAGADVLFGVYDEAVCEVDPDVTAADIEHEMSWCPDWLEGCPIRAEAEEVSRYTK